MIQFFWRDYAWKWPDTWVWCIENCCEKGCTRVDVGFWGFYILRNGCKGEQ